MQALILKSNSVVVEVTSTAFDVTSDLFWADCPADVVAYEYEYVDGEFKKLPPPAINPEAIQNVAKQCLANTDWVNQPDVYDPLLTPHLLNRDEFLAYRETIRGYLVTPPTQDFVWPDEPQAIWSV